MIFYLLFPMGEIQDCELQKRIRLNLRSESIPDRISDRRTEFQTLSVLLNYIDSRTNPEYELENAQISGLNSGFTYNKSLFIK